MTRARTYTFAAALSCALLACGPHRDPTEPGAIPVRAGRAVQRKATGGYPRDRRPPGVAVAPQDVMVGTVLLSTDTMHDKKSWFGPSKLRPIGAAAVPFAMYLNKIHRKLHPQFADSFLAALDELPRAHHLQQPSLATTVGLIIRGRDGHVLRRSVLRSSGSTAFDISALSAIDLASPFAAAPVAIHSPDGNVYIHWELRRDQMACSTMQAHPYLLR